jgi:crossover junction endodeoxyribonuclease RuvC
VIIGIDPGITGAAAFFSNDGRLHAIEDMPLMEVKVGGKTRQRVSGRWFAEVVRQMDRASYGGQHRAFLEQVGPSSSAAGSFTFGRSVGVVEGVLAALGIPVTLISPHRWKPAMAPGNDKNVSRAAAAALFPAHAALFARVKDDGRAEAALIGLFGLRNL